MSPRCTCGDIDFSGPEWVERVVTTRTTHCFDGRPCFENRLDLDAVRASLSNFDQAHPTRGACQHERYWREVLPALVAEVERLRELLHNTDMAMVLAIGRIRRGTPGAAITGLAAASNRAKAMLDHREGE